MAGTSGLRIGLTGGIGSGKSTVAAAFVQLGAVLIDTDAISRSLTAPGGAAINPIRAAFGPGTLDGDGALDRVRMRELVFTDATAKSRLEAILHPMIGAECQRQALVAAGRVVVFDVPLLVESQNWRTRVDRVVVVECTEATQAQRVMSRSGWTLEAINAVISQQATRDARRAAADAVIYNEGLTLGQLADEVAVLWTRWMPMEQSFGSSGATPS